MKPPGSGPDSPRRRAQGRRRSISRPSPVPAPRRFYAAAGVAPAASGFAVVLDGREARTPRAAPLVLPTAALAALVAAEWAAQGERIEFAAMPATRLAHTALDAVARDPAAAAAAVAAYGETDLVCHFAAAPRGLRARQEAAWRPLLGWAKTAHGLAFAATDGALAVAQPAATLERLAALVAGQELFTLAGLAFAAPLFASVVIALALAAGRLDAAAAFAASRVDEDFQAEQWGLDAEAERAAARLRAEADMAEAWFAALPPLSAPARGG